MARKGSWGKSSGLLLCFLTRIPYFVLNDHVLFISSRSPLQNAEANTESVLELRSEGLLWECAELVGASTGQHAKAAGSQGTGILVLRGKQKSCGPQCRKSSV